MATLTPDPQNGADNSRADSGEQRLVVLVADLAAEAVRSSFGLAEQAGVAGWADVVFRNVAANGVAARGTIAVQVFARPDHATDDSTDLLIGRVDNVGLNLQPGATQSVRVPVHLPNAPNDYILVGVVDPGGAIAESNTENNTFSSEAVIQVRTPFVDISVSLEPVGLPLTATAGGRVSVTVGLQNVGNEAVRGSGTLQVFARPANPGDELLLLAESGTRLRLNPSATTAPRVTFVMPSTIPGGIYDVIVRFVPGVGIFDPNEKNNQAEQAASAANHN